jgi:hypothetical protein
LSLLLWLRKTWKILFIRGDILAQVRGMKKGRQNTGPQGSKLVSALPALEEPAGRLDPRPGDGVGVRGDPGDLQRRQLFGQDLAVDAARRGAQEPAAGEEDQGEARLTNSSLDLVRWCPPGRCRRDPR